MIFLKAKMPQILHMPFESFFADCYIKGFFTLTDQKVKETLANLYYLRFRKNLLNLMNL
jgi:hypothetical protein